MRVLSAWPHGISEVNRWFESSHRRPFLAKVLCCRCDAYGSSQRVPSLSHMQWDRRSHYHLTPLLRYQGLCISSHDVDYRSSIADLDRPWPSSSLLLALFLLRPLKPESGFRVTIQVWSHRGHCLQWSRHRQSSRRSPETRLQLGVDPV